jgi:KDO2-lipid IV(A) lauroyltransferase
VVVLTAHLGNWEIGGPLLAGHGAKLTAITQAEPGRGLTELRRQSRARWGIETVVIGDDAFGFVEIIRRLQEGGTTALLIDRAPGTRTVTAELFGRPFQASPAAAELARSTGCALVGVSIVRIGDKYHAKVLPEFLYDRRALASRDARQLLTQEILRAFEPEIRRHPDQWFHFVPVWPHANQDGP